MKNWLQFEIVLGDISSLPQKLDNPVCLITVLNVELEISNGV